MAFRGGAQLLLRALLGTRRSMTSRMARASRRFASQARAPEVCRVPVGRTTGLVSASRPQVPRLFRVPLHLAGKSTRVTRSTATVEPAMGALRPVHWNIHRTVPHLRARRREAPATTTAKSVLGAVAPRRRAGRFLDPRRVSSRNGVASRPRDPSERVHVVSRTDPPRTTGCLAVSRGFTPRRVGGARVGDPRPRPPVPRAHRDRGALTSSPTSRAGCHGRDQRCGVPGEDRECCAALRTRSSTASRAAGDPAAGIEAAARHVMYSPIT